MTLFENIKPGSRLRGLDPSGVAYVVQATGFGSDALNVVFRANSRVGERLVTRGEEAGSEFVEAGWTYWFNADSRLRCLASEACRIRAGLSVCRGYAFVVSAALWSAGEREHAQVQREARTGK